MSDARLILRAAAVVRQQDQFSMTDAEVEADVADTLWSLATDTTAGWERTYLAASLSQAA